MILSQDLIVQFLKRQLKKGELTFSNRDLVAHFTPFLAAEDDQIRRKSIIFVHLEVDRADGWLTVRQVYVMEFDRLKTKKKIF